MTFLNKTLIATAVMVSFAANAQSIQHLSANQIGSMTELRISFDDAPATPTAYYYDNKLVLDFDAVDAPSLPRSTLINLGNIGEVTTVSADGKTRVVVALNAPSTYNIGFDGNDLLLAVQGNHVASQASQTYIDDATTKSVNGTSTISLQNNPLLNPTRTVSASSQTAGLTGLRVNDNQITATLGSESVPVDVQRQGNRLVIRTAGTPIPKSLLRRINGSGLIKSVEAANHGQSGVVTINIGDDFEYQAYQSGTTLSVTVSQPELLRAPTLEEKVYTGQPLSVEFQDLPIRIVLDALAKFTNMNIVASDNVQGNITLRLQNVPWDQALDIILKSKSLAKRENGNVILVAPAVELAEQEAKELEAQQKVTTYEPLRTDYIRLNYAQAQTVFEFFEKVRSNPGRNNNNSNVNDNLGREDVGLLSDRGSVIVDTRTNTLIVKDTPKSIANIRALVEKIDIPVQQVMIEARLVNATEGFSKQLGVRWGILSNTRNLNIGGSDTTLHNYRAPRSDGVMTVDRPANLGVNLGVDGIGSSPAGRIAFSILNMSDAILDLELSALQADSRGEVISSPRVMTANQQKARISSGQQIPYQTVDEKGAVSIQFREASLVLEATPNITPEGRIGMQIDIRNGTAVGIGTPGMHIDEDNLQTNVVVDDGQTIVLGGVFRNTRGTGVDKVPFFGDLPYVGRLFKKDVRSDEKRELLIFITPKIVNDGLNRF